jgi:hypothetical protein
MNRGGVARSPWFRCLSHSKRLKGQHAPAVDLFLVHPAFMVERASNEGRLRKLDGGRSERHASLCIGQGKKLADTELCLSPRVPGGKLSPKSRHLSPLEKTEGPEVVDFRALSPPATPAARS